MFYLSSTPSSTVLKGNSAAPRVTEGIKAQKGK